MLRKSYHRDLDRAYVVEKLPGVATVVVDLFEKIPEEEPYDILKLPSSITQANQMKEQTA